MRKKTNLILGIIISLLLVGSAFSVDWIFGVVYVFSVAYSWYSGVLEKRPVIPVAIFVGGLIIRIAITVFLPSVLEAKTLIDLVISGLIFFAVLVLGYKVKKGAIRIKKKSR